MADLSEIDLDGGASEGEATLHGHDDEFAISEGPTSSDEEDSSHSKTEDLHLYFRQSWKAKLGTTGIVIIAFFAISIVMTSALLIFSYTSIGRSFLQGLKFFIF
ncbi:MAG: hypothetical protein BM556_10435 [Bacteriovorax sp. MedPE-SWde]|nr:MAG: hypothetical protein BM556_10435 [Bacteriovorax sp. MedPE-SWde]